ncbi:MAG: hypothetical protein LBQ18_07010 [Campylobacteraceae bacterium]|jgi:hypothetical protein|nr:hypothetical protein [Campylobacteraceae bacterium]
MSEPITDNEEAMYKASQSEFIYVKIGHLIPAGLCFLISSLTLVSTFTNPKTSGIVIVLIAGLLFIMGVYVTLQILTFKELIVYKDRVVIDKYIFGKSSININDIEYIDTTSSVFYNQMNFIHKKEFLSSLKYSILTLGVEEIFEIEELIKKLQKGQSNG